MDYKKTFKNITLLSASTIAAMHCINKYIYHKSTSFNNKNKLLTKMRYFDYDWHDSKIKYSVYGSGRPVLLIHDLSVCSSSYEWNAIIEKLGKNKKVYTVDLPGCGESDKYNFVYTNYLYTQFIRDFIKDIIKEQVTVVSTGFSAPFSTILYTSDDSMIEHLILVNPASPIFESSVPKSLIKTTKYLFTLPIISRFIYNLSTRKGLIEKTFNQKFYYFPHKVNKKDILTYYKNCQEGNTHGKYLYSSFLCGFMNYNILKSLSLIKKDVSIIVGKSDSSSIENVKLYKENLSSVNISIIEHSKHLPQLETPEKFVEILMKHL